MPMPKPISWPEPTPLLRQRPDGVTHFERHQHGLERGVINRNGIIEDDHHAVARVTLKCSAILDNALTDGRVIIAQKRHNVLGVCTFGKASETAQIAEERRNLPAMAFELFLGPGRNDQISHLRRKKAPQPTHAFDFVHLVRDALF